MIKIKVFYRHIFVIMGLIAVLSTYSIPQTFDLQQARIISNQAQRLIVQGKWSEALEKLTQGLHRCGDQAEAKECRGLLNFSLGYFYQVRAEENADSRETDLENAVVHYRQSLKNLPENVQVIGNLALALKQAGKWWIAICELKKATELDPENRSLYYLEIGDILSENDNIEDALQYYQRCIQLEPIHETAHWKILNIYRRLGNEGITDLFNYSNRLRESNQVELAKNGYELVIELAYDSNKTLTEKALVNWADIGSSSGWISEESLQSLLSKVKWTSRAVEELSALVSNPEIETRHLDWWASDRHRRHVAASVLKVIGSDHLSKGRPHRAAHIYEQALIIAPHVSEYARMELRPIMSMQINVELASLYYRHKEIDLDGRKFKNLERELFNEKAMYYAERDMESIHRAHTVLGLIYAERGQWTSSWRPANAIFQLENALGTAKRLESDDIRNFKPLPHLLRHLAEGYKAINKNKEAYATYLEAATGYLDLDSLKQAESSFKDAIYFYSEGGISRAPNEKSIKRIIDVRKQIDLITADHFRPESAAYISITKQIEKLFTSTSLGLDPSYIKRQYFKVLSDLGDKANQFGAIREALYFHTTALGVIKDEKVLSSMDDVVRLDKIKNTVIRNIEIDDSGKIIGMESNLESNPNYVGGGFWWLNIPSESQPIQIGASSDFLFAGKIINQICKEPTLSALDFKASVQKGKVTLYQGRKSLEIMQRATSLVESVSGVKEVIVKKKKI